MKTYSLDKGHKMTAETNKALRQAVTVYENGTTSAKFGTSFSENTPIEEIISWANNHINNPPKNDFMKTEQPKMYRLINDDECYYAQFGLIETNLYSSDTIVYGTRKIQDLVDNKQSDWELVTDEPEPFTPTHEVNNGLLRNEPVKVIHAKSDGFCKVEDREGISHFFHIDDLTPLDIEQQTTLTAQQYESLISTMYKMFGVKSPNQIVKTWANQNNVKILEQ